MCNCFDEWIVLHVCSFLFDVLRAFCKIKPWSFVSSYFIFISHTSQLCLLNVLLLWLFVVDNSLFVLHELYECSHRATTKPQVKDKVCKTPRLDLRIRFRSNWVTAAEIRPLCLVSADVGKSAQSVIKTLTADGADSVHRPHLTHCPWCNNIRARSDNVNAVCTSRDCFYHRWVLAAQDQSEAVREVESFRVWSNLLRSSGGEMV